MDSFIIVTRSGRKTTENRSEATDIQRFEIFIVASNCTHKKTELICHCYLFKCPQKRIKFLEGFAVGGSAPLTLVGAPPKTPFWIRLHE